MKSYVRVVDNSGSFLAQCIGVPALDCFARTGDIITVSLKSVYPGKKALRGTVSRAVVVRTIKERLLFTGDVLKFSDNSVVLVNESLVPVSKRLSGPVSKELRPRFDRWGLRVKYLRVLALTAYII